MSDWVVLSTSAGATLPLAETLTEDGYDAWTPSRRVNQRRIRWTVARSVRVPILAGIVFVRREHLFDLLELERMRVKPRRGVGLSRPAHARFTIMRDPLHGNGIALVDDRNLAALRDAEVPAKVKRTHRPFEDGASVRVTRGSFEGMTGVVERSDRQSAEVWLALFGRHFRTKIPTSILRLDQLEGLQSTTDTAARKAA